jgi:hypothetical protein
VLSKNQSRVTAWVREVFTNAETEDVPERALRMAEEALELAQACDVDAATLHRLVDYVFSRPVGAPGAEIAGTMVTVYALAAALGVDAQTVFEAELLRIRQPEVIERCRRRQHEKRAALTPSSTLDRLQPNMLLTRVVGRREPHRTPDETPELTPFERAKKPPPQVR